MESNFLSMHVGKIIDRVIKEKGVKKSKVAERINRTPQALNSILRREYCSTDIIENLSEALEVNLFQVISQSSNIYSTEIETPKSEEPVVGYHTDEFGEISITITLKAEQKEKILRIIGL